MIIQYRHILYVDIYYLLRPENLQNMNTSQICGSKSLLLWLYLFENLTKSDFGTKPQNANLTTTSLRERRQR